MFWSKLCKSTWNCAWNLAFISCNLSHLPAGRPSCCSNVICKRDRKTVVTWHSQFYGLRFSMKNLLKVSVINNYNWLGDFLLACAFESTPRRLPCWFTLCSFAAFCLPSLPSQPLLGPFTVLCSVEFSFFILSRDQCYTFLWEVGWLTLRTVVMVVVPICILCTFTCLSPTVLTISTHSPDKYCQSAS